MNPIRTILFDLDGTLTDPAEGITGCMRYAMEQLDRPVPPRQELASWIGASLREVFASLCAPADNDLVERAVTFYRERFSTVGLYENGVYDGVPEMLAALRSMDLDLFVATSKPTIYAAKIIEHFSLDTWFVGVHGNELNGRLDDKADLLRELIAERQLDPQETIMVGDRKHDVLAAQRHGIRSIGVTYGYGSREELEMAGADHICDDPLEVLGRVREIWG